ncbi:predicted protein [Sclerotinia sclerotiorum 1980 UF-70]|uniref:Uncharacterized protein n=1 Tax=Sclerotinia sclerotiorum (strain ATCC 18683 / 1980 / Ss-1) TaxID=665079 RepID=A7ELK7_SCLS1|nr:predicted protein [Sclerotinia sclerotiorum 1980 UF-70]EDO03723.1 predicted protein [Sclerotinia sclerotiorum 1980 UF-70]
MVLLSWPEAFDVCVNTGVKKKQNSIHKMLDLRTGAED